MKGVVAFALSALLTGLVGGVYAAHYQFAGPSLFDFSTLMFTLAMVVVDFAKEMGDFRNFVLGVTLVVLVILMPKGLAHLTTTFWQRQCDSSKTKRGKV